ncbi:MAG: ABC transporter permease subunit [Euryarchaeota archaeon]|nr:ABC transporter permease subunit [Euryarchaeota archaeon]
MKVLALAYKELKDILSEKIYLFGFLLQLFIVMGIVLIGFSYSYIAKMEEKPSVTTNDKNLAEFLSDEDILYSYSKNFLGDAYIQNRGGEVYVYTNDEDLFNQLEPRIEEYYFRGQEPLRQPIAKIEHIKKKEVVPEFIEIMYSLLVPIVLLLPVFLSMNMLSDSIVGEKERKTFEILLASPLTRFEIILGKIIPVVSLGFVQVSLWLFVISRKNIHIKNIAVLYAFLLVLMVLFFSLSVIFSMISSNIREANLYLTLFMMGLSFLMFVPLPSMGVLDGIITYSPVVGIVKITTNALSISIVPYFIIYLALALTTIFIAKKVLEKDEGLKL